MLFLVAIILKQTFEYCFAENYKYQSNKKLFLLYWKAFRIGLKKEKGVLKICSQFTGEYPCISVISIKLLWNFIEITRRRGCSPVNLLHFLRIPIPKNTFEGLLPYKTSFSWNESVLMIPVTTQYFNSNQANASFLYPLKISESQKCGA